MIVDYHMHLRGPAEGAKGPVELTVGAVERFVEQAAARGVDEIAFTEHMYYFRQAEPFLEHPVPPRPGRARPRRLLRRGAARARSQGLPVKLALELEWLPGSEQELAELVRPYPWDFLLGSVHLVDGEAVDMEPGAWAGREVDEVWRRYFAELAALARSGLADVLAHPDLVKIYGRRPDAGDRRRVPRAGRGRGGRGRRGGRGLDRRPAQAGRRALPGRGVPRALPRAGRRRHAARRTRTLPRDVGRDFDAGLELLRAAGYGTITVFTGRAARQEPLG